MAFRTRRFSGRRSFRRTAINGGWSGFSGTQNMDPSTWYAVNLWEATNSDLVNASGILTPRRIVIHFSLRVLGAASEVALARWYIAAFQTDLTQSVPSALIVDPNSADTDLMEKRLLTTGQWVGVQPASVANGAPYVVSNETLDLKPRGFKFSAQQDELDWVIGATGTTNPNVALTFQVRTYCTWK